MRNYRVINVLQNCPKPVKTISRRNAAFLFLACKIGRCLALFAFAVELAQIGTLLQCFETHLPFATEQLRRTALRKRGLVPWKFHCIDQLAIHVVTCSINCFILWRRRFCHPPSDLATSGYPSQIQQQILHAFQGGVFQISFIWVAYSFVFMSMHQW